MGCKKIGKFALCNLRSSSVSNPSFLFDAYTNEYKKNISNSCPTCNELETRVKKNHAQFVQKKEIYNKVSNPNMKKQIETTLLEMKNRFEPINDVYKETCNNHKKFSFTL